RELSADRRRSAGHALRAHRRRRARDARSQPEPARAQPGHRRCRVTGVVVLVALLGAAVFIIATVIKNTYVCSPAEVLIFSGRTWTLADGRVVGFRAVRGGRAVRMPLVERVDRMPLTNMAIELSVTNAFSRGGVPLNVVAVANIKFPSEEPLLHSALERF